MPAPLRYQIQPKNPEAHLYEVSLTVGTPDSSGQVFEMPAWIPGSYMIRDYAKHVVAIRAESDGLAVPMKKLDKSRWQAEPVDRPLTVVADIYAYDPSVRGAHLDATHAYFNGPCVFLSVSGQRAIALANSRSSRPMRLPERTGAWQRRCAAVTRSNMGSVSYLADDYAELIDHPVEISQLTIGEFDVRGIPHAIAIRGRVRVDITRLCHDLRRICEQHIDFLGAPDGLDRYLFLLHAPGYWLRWARASLVIKPGLFSRRSSTACGL